MSLTRFSITLPLIVVCAMAVVGCAECPKTPTEFCEYPSEAGLLLTIEAVGETDAKDAESELLDQYVVVVLTNATEASVDIDCRLLRDDYLVQVFDKSGRRLPMAAFEPPEPFVKDEHLIRLNPEQSVSSYVWLFPLGYEDEVAPPYFVSARFLGKLQDTPRLDTVYTQRIRSNTIVIRR